MHPSYPHRPPEEHTLIILITYLSILTYTIPPKSPPYLNPVISIINKKKMHSTKKYDMYALYVRVCACYIRMRVCVCVGVDTYTPHKHTY